MQPWRRGQAEDLKDRGPSRRTASSGGGTSDGGKVSDALRPGGHMPQIDFLNAERAAPPRVFLSVIAAFNEGARGGAADLGTPLESLQGQSFLPSAVLEHWPSLFWLAETIPPTID